MSRKEEKEKNDKNEKNEENEENEETPKKTKKEKKKEKERDEKRGGSTTTTLARPTRGRGTPYSYGVDGQPGDVVNELVQLREKKKAGEERQADDKRQKAQGRKQKEESRGSVRRIHFRLSDCHGFDLPRSRKEDGHLPCWPCRGHVWRYGVVASS